MSEEFELKLRALFEAPERPPDEVFAARVRAAILAEARMREQKRALARRALAEGSAALVLILSFAMLARTSPAIGRDQAIPISSPVLAGLLLLALGLVALATTKFDLRSADPHQ